MATVNCLVILAQSPLIGHNNCCIFCVNMTAQGTSGDLAFANSVCRCAVVGKDFYSAWNSTGTT